MNAESERSQSERSLTKTPVPSYEAYRDIYIEAGQYLSPKDRARTSGFVELTSDDVLVKKETIVRALARSGCSNKEIADVIGLQATTLSSPKWKAVLDESRAELKATIRKTQIKVAIEKEDTSMLKWLGQQYLGQSAKEQSRQVVSLASLSDAELEKLGNSLGAFDDINDDAEAAEQQ